MSTSHTFSHPRHLVTTPQQQPHDQQLVSKIPTQNKACPEPSVHKISAPLVASPHLPTVVPSHQTHIRASSSTLALDKSHTSVPRRTAATQPPPRALPHLPSRPTAHPSHSSSSRPKRQAAPSTFHARPLRAFSTLPFPVELTSTQGGSILERHPWRLLSPKPKYRLILPFHGHHRP